VAVLGAGRGEDREVSEDGEAGEVGEVSEAGPKRVPDDEGAALLTPPRLLHARAVAQSQATPRDIWPDRDVTIAPAPGACECASVFGTVASTRHFADRLARDDAGRAHPRL
jgi:hypothetical protein